MELQSVWVLDVFVELHKKKIFIGSGAGLSTRGHQKPVRDAVIVAASTWINL